MGSAVFQVSDDRSEVLQVLANRLKLLLCVLGALLVVVESIRLPIWTFLTYLFLCVAYFSVVVKAFGSGFALLFSVFFVGLFIPILTEIL